MPSLKTGASLLFLACFLILQLSCGSSSNPNQPTVSGVKPRAFISNTEAGLLQIIDAGHDTLVTTHSVSIGGRPGLMALTPDKLVTLVFNTANNTLSVVDNTQETRRATITLPSWTESIAVGPNNDVAFAALPAATVLGQPAGGLAIVGLLNNQLRATINIPNVHWVVVNHAGNRVLAFSDNSDSVAILDANGNILKNVSGFDRPVWAVFSDGDKIAYILNCGPECGGNSAGVTVLNMDSNTPGATVGLAGATMGLLNNGTLYVAGSGSGVGTLQLVKAADLSASTPINISNGYHHRMALASNNKLFIGSRGCTNVGSGCLTIFDTSANTAVVDKPNGDVTGIQPIAGRNVVYVVEGGELRIFDTTTNAPSTKSFIDIVGAATDVKEVD